MGANFIDEDGHSKPLIMGCYGIGITRVMSAVVEQNNDENGIIWPMSVAPYKVIVIPAVAKSEEQMRIANDIYDKLIANGIDSILDDRNERTGVKFKDADLIGIPLRITVGRAINEGNVEFKRRSQNEPELVSIEGIVEKVKNEIR